MQRASTGPNVNEKFVSDPQYARFCGTTRRQVKTGIARDTNGNTCSPMNFADLMALLKFLTPDQEMFFANVVGARSRCPEETVNVHVPCWIGAVRYETEGDFLVVLASAADTKAKSTRFMTAKVSGLPAVGRDLETLTNVRRQLIDFFPTQVLGEAFHEPDPAIKVCIEGSLFFMLSHHRFSESGPPGMHPNTRWEIHPVTSILRG